MGSCKSEVLGPGTEQVRGILPNSLSTSLENSTRGSAEDWEPGNPVKSWKSQKAKNCTSAQDKAETSV